MTVRKPSISELKKIAEEYNLGLSEQELLTYQGYIGESLASYDRLDQLVEPAPLPVEYFRPQGYKPEPEDNKFNAWSWKVSIKGNGEGKLAGKKIAIKDNISIAGIPMVNGSKVLEGFVPNEDATIITRILAAGGEIIGKTTCENLCFSGGSHTSASGPVPNPADPTRMAGGSSSGSAVVLAQNEADIAIGGDQGGSIRIPASWTGVVGLKPTYGLVPYTGAFPMELTLDHLGPMARTVEECALMLEVIAGPDGLDPRQAGGSVKEYTKSLVGHANGLKIGVVKEGFGWEGSEQDSDGLVRESAYEFERCGASVEEVSIPMHKDGIHIWSVIAAEGGTSLMMRGNGMGTNWKGYYSKQILDVFANGRKNRANDLPDTVKKVLLQGEYMSRAYNGRYYATAQNLAIKLKQAYDQAFEQYDVLIMPTMLMKATPIPSPMASREEFWTRAWETLTNCAPFNITGHPAISIPCGNANGLPVGMMIIGRYGDDETVLRAAHAYEMMLKSVTV